MPANPRARTGRGAVPALAAAPHRPRPRRRRPLGAIYEIGALAALNESLSIDLNDADVYVGVSAGGFIAAALCNGITPHQMSRVFIEGDRSHDRFEPSILLRPALKEYRAAPGVGAAAAGGRALALRARHQHDDERLRAPRPRDPDRHLQRRAGRQVPRRIFSQAGRTNDFRQLAHKLFLVATDLDTGESLAFGTPGLDDVPISRAVQASAALPGLFPPTEIKGRYFVDGALRKTLHASMALEQGIDLMLCLNPLVPFDASPHHRTRDHEHHLDKLVEGGLPVVLAQTYRSIIHSRLGAGMERYKTVYPDTDIVLFEPNRADADMFFTNLFSYSSRRRLCEHAYQKTREELWKRRHELTPVLERHGVEIRTDVLRDESMTLVKSLRKSRGLWRETASTAATRPLTHTLDDLERWLRWLAAA